MTKPTIHLNGSSPADLCDTYAAAAAAMRQAAEALSQCSPNGRDYYPQGEGVFRVALDEHHARLEKINQVRVELEELAEHCADERDARAKNRH